jgi:molybdate transport system ATP-binding protein
VTPDQPGPDQSTAAPADALVADVVVERREFRLQTRIEVAPGQVLAVLGPNGAGKSTVLRALAGLLAIDRGRITIGEQVWDDADDGRFTPAADRAVGLVFQDYRLFPHLSVLDNVAFSGRARGTARRQARSDAARQLAQLGLAELGDRRPAHLSGGQTQRVALARALASNPRLLLLDEPLAALDARARLEIRGELRRQLSAFHGPTVLVTHDPLEAMVLADRVLVLEGGRTVQEGLPAEVARRPATDYVARLVGLNLYTGSLVDRASRRVELDSGGTLFAAGHDPQDHAVIPLTSARMLVALSPTAISLHVHEPDPGSARNLWQGRITGLELLTDRVRVAVEGMPDALVDVTPAAVAALSLQAGQQVWMTAKATEVIAYPDPAAVRRTDAPAEPAGSDPAGSEPAGSDPAGSEPAGSEPAAAQATDDLPLGPPGH